MLRLHILRRKKIVFIALFNILLGTLILFTAPKSSHFANITNDISKIKLDDYIPDSIAGNLFGSKPLPKYSRSVIKGSPFQNIINLNNTLNSLINLNESSEKQKRTLNNWTKSSLLDQCKILVHSIYYNDNEHDWSNDETVSGTQDDKFLSLMSERLRIYNYCFIEGNLDTSEVLEELDVFNFNQKMFPFLKQPTMDEAIAPKILNLKNMQYLATEPKANQYNKNFWHSWLKSSKGKGIVTTFDKQYPLDYFFKLLAVLHHSGNKLPIQIVIPENNISEEDINLISKVSNELNQQVYLVTYLDMLDNSNYVSILNQKYYATLFNTFDEFIMLDISVVPFIPLKDFFKFKQYKESGLYVSRGRTNNEKVKSKFIQDLKSLEPTQHEVDMIETDLAFTTSTGGNNITTNGLVFDLVVKDKIKNISDLSLYIVNKRENLSGLIMATMLSINKRLEKQLDNDTNEFFWIGAHFAGKNYAFEDQDAALMDSPRKLYNENGQYYKTVACDSHVAHVFDNKLIWASGGMSKVAHPYTFIPEIEGSEANIENNDENKDQNEIEVEEEAEKNTEEVVESGEEPGEAIMNAHGESKEDADSVDESEGQAQTNPEAKVNKRNMQKERNEELNKINTVKKFDGLLIPDRKFNIWRPDVNEFGETFCSSAVENGGLESPHGTVIRFSRKMNKKINEIADLWYNTKF